MAYMRICAQCSAYYEAPPAAYNNPRIAPYCPRCLAREAQRTSAAADRDEPGRATMKVSDRCAECGAVHPDGADRRQRPLPLRQHAGEHLHGERRGAAGRQAALGVQRPRRRHRGRAALHRGPPDRHARAGSREPAPLRDEARPVPSDAPRGGAGGRPARPAEPEALRPDRLAGRHDRRRRVKKATITVTAEVADDWAPFDREDAQFEIEQIVKTAIGEFGTLKTLRVVLAGWPREPGRS
jgi:hypothetical protein